jgi:hypothetical protein
MQPEYGEDDSEEDEEEPDRSHMTTEAETIAERNQREAMETEQNIQTIVEQAKAESSNSWIWTVYHDGGATPDKDRKPPAVESIAGWGYHTTLR